MTQSKLLNNGQKLKLPMLLFCVLSVTACAHNSPPPPCSCPALPAHPSVTMQQPSQDYSISAQALIKTWRDKLKATPLLSDY